MLTETQQTVAEWLEELATSNESSDPENAKMQSLLRRVGCSKAICTCGIVYLEGQGTIDAPPTSIHLTAKMLAKVVNKFALMS